MKRISKYNSCGRDNEKLFNMGFHPVMLYIFPTAWLISLPFNFVVDSIVLLIGFKIFGKEKVWLNWRRSILLSWIFGYIADLIASFFLMGCEFAAGRFKTGIIGNAFSGVIPFLLTLVSVLIAGVLIYVFNIKIALRKTELDQKTRQKVALLMALVTMPYMFFMPLTF